MIIQIPWSKKYTYEWIVFKFVPKVFHFMDEDGRVLIFKNANAKFKVIKTSNKQV